MNTGIFGGAFDPFHNEHRGIIECAKRELNLDRIVIVPSYIPPHKSGKLSDYSFRRETVRLGTADLSYVVIDDIEYERNTTNPTSVVLPLLKEKYPSDNFFFIMGGDSVKNFHKWINPQIIADTASLAVCARSGCGDIFSAAEYVRSEYKANVVILPFEGDWVSSSAIKATAELGFPIYGVSEEVAEFIKENSLYNRFADVIAMMKSDVPESTFMHCARVTVFAENFCGLLGLKYEDVFLSALLHDNAKKIRKDIAGVPAPVVHQFVGAERAQSVYGIENADILNAIRYHTTGRIEMSKLEKLIYCADMLEENRSFPGVEQLRELIFSDFEAGFRACVKATLTHLKETGGEICPLTEECAAYYDIDI